MNSSRLNTLDVKTYRDTQSNGLFSRANQYADSSASKLRPAANRLYSRLGDFPIVNLEKNDISIRPTHTNGGIGSRIGLGGALSDQTSSRLSIFQTGKNYGNAVPSTVTASAAGAATTVAAAAAAAATSASKIGVAGTSNATTANGHASTSRDDEPIVPSSSDYDANPKQSSLDALKQSVLDVEISRKRIHCDVSFLSVRLWFDIF